MEIRQPRNPARPRQRSVADRLSTEWRTFGRSAQNAACYCVVELRQRYAEVCVSPTSAGATGSRSGSLPSPNGLLAHRAQEGLKSRTRGADRVG
jgi:hypothetical protein